MSDFVSHPLLKENIIEKREYQEILAENALAKGNTLIVAPTALGKTVVAALIAANILEKHKDQKILFLAPTKPLAVQHYNSMKQFLALDESKFSLLTGTVRPSERKEEWNKALVITGTPQTIENDLINDSISLKDVSLLIIDEAHRAVKGYSYVFIAERYRQNPQGLLLALTASPGGTREKIQEVCENLFIKNIEIKTEQDPDVAPYVHKKDIEWKKVAFPAELNTIRKLFDSYMREKFQKLKEMGFLSKSNPRKYSKRDLLWLQGRLLQSRNKNPQSFYGMSLTAGLLKVHHAMLLVETQGIEPLLNYLDRLKTDKTKASKQILNDSRIQKAIMLANNLKNAGKEHPKIDLLIQTVQDQVGQGKSVIVFSHYREMAERLKNLLREKDVGCEKFIGQATRGADIGLTQKKQQELIQRFKRKEFNVLITTSVGEEGLDIPSVDAVIFYEPVPSEIRFIQRRGRTARKRPGKIIILITEGTKDETYYWSSTQKEKKMHKVLREMDELSSEKQKTLESFVEFEKPKYATIFVDNRERASGIARELLNQDVKIKSKQLDVGDFLLSDRVVVERKTGLDFVNSIIDGRLFKQAYELTQNFESPIIIIEGPVYGVRNIHENAIRGALSSIVLDYGIPVLHTRDIADSAAILSQMARREQLESNRTVRVKGKKKAQTLEEQMQFIIESLPGVGPLSAKALLKHFNSIERVFKANERELHQVEGIGKKRAKEIRKIIESNYDVK